MEEEKKKKSKQERNAWRKERHTLRQASQSDLCQGCLMDDFEGRPEEIWKSLELNVESFLSTRQRWKPVLAAGRKRSFSRVLLLLRWRRKSKAKHLMKSRNGLLDLADSIYYEIKTLPLEDEDEWIQRR